MRKYLALALLLVGVASVPVASQQLGPVNVPPPPCVAFGTTTGTCVQGAGALGTPSSGNGSNITNVNAATLGGATFAAPGAIGGGTPGTGAFTTMTATGKLTGTGDNVGATFNATGAFTGNAIAQQRNSATTLVIQTAMAADGGCIGTAQDDTCIRANDKDIFLSGNNGVGYSVRIKANNTLQFGTSTANGTAAVAATAALGPTGTTCVIASWVTVLDSAGNTRYTPLFSCS